MKMSPLCVNNGPNKSNYLIHFSTDIADVYDLLSYTELIVIGSVSNKTVIVFIQEH